MKRKRLFFTLLLIFVSITFWGCGLTKKNSEKSKTKDLSIVTTFYPIYEFTKKVAGDRADVTMLIPAGTDVHGFELSAKDIAKINRADVFIYSSPAMETWVGSLMNSLDNEDLTIVRSAEKDIFMPPEASTETAVQALPIAEAGVWSDFTVPESVQVKGLLDHYHTHDHIQLEVQGADQVKGKLQWYVQQAAGTWAAIKDQDGPVFETQAEQSSFNLKAVIFNKENQPIAQSQTVAVKIENHGNLDPHVWLDPVLAQKQVDTIKAALIQVDPDGKAAYEENAREFNAELAELDEEFAEAFADAKQKVFVVQHEAFGYLAHRYGLRQLSIGGLSTEVEPSPSRLAEISQLVAEYQLPVIYYQHGASSAIAHTVAEETGTQIDILYDLEGITQEMKDGGIGYLVLMRKNLEALKHSIH